MKITVFNGLNYLASYADLASLGKDPAKNEGRTIRFAPLTYQSLNPDLNAWAATRRP